MMKLGTFGRASLVLAGSVAVAATAQQTSAPPAPSATASGLPISDEVQFLAQDDPSIRKATAIVNGAIITGTNLDHRMALIVLASQGQIPQSEMQRLREQVLRNLVDETLQIQAAEAQDIKVEPSEIDAQFARFAQQFGYNAKTFGPYLRSVGSSEESVKRQIHGEIAWARLQRRMIEPFVNVSEEEVQSFIQRMNAARGTQEYKVSEIFLSATPETAAETRANAARIVEQLRAGGSFKAYARQFSEASTAAVGGYLDWVRASSCPSRSLRRPGLCQLGRSAIRLRSRADIRFSRSKTRARSSLPTRGTPFSALSRSP
jgi:peptidyl-prolyl cis-trans isomerase SurA